MKLIYTIYGTILLFAFIFPIGGFGDYDSKRIIQLGLIITLNLIFIVTVYVIKNNVRPLVKIPKNIFYAIILFIFSGVISSINSLGINYALLDVVYHLVLFLFFILITPIKKSDKIILGRIIINTALLFSFLYLTLFFINYFEAIYDKHKPLWPEKFVSISTESGQNLRIHFNDKDVLYFANRRLFNHVQTLTLPLILGAYLYFNIETKRFHSKLIIILLSGWWMLLIGSGARGSFLGLFVGFIILLIIFKKQLTSFIRPVITSILFGFIGYLILFILIPEAGNNQSIFRSSSSGRLMIWAYALELWWANPFFGIGPYHFAKVNDVINIAGPHNIFLTYLTEWGVFAFLCLCFISIKVFSAIKAGLTLQYGNPKSQMVYLCIFWSLISGFIHSMVSGVYIAPLGQLWGISIIAWLFGQYQGTTSLDNNNFTLNKKYVSLLLMAVFALFIYQLIYVVDFPLQLEGTIKYPRFWEQGKFLNNQ